MGIPESFQSLLSRISPLQSELDVAKGHADSVKTRLQSSFNLKKFVVVGSHSRETAIRWYSDVDHFAVFSRDEFRWGSDYKSSNTVLVSLRDDLAQRFRQTQVRRDGPAVVVSFGQGDYSVDVVPAMFWEMNKDNWPIYYIPDGNGGWIRTSPELHNKGDESLGRDPTVFDRVEWFAPELRVRNHDETRVRFHCRLTGPTHESLVVGRGQQGVDLPVEDHYVSRRHARFFARGGEHLVEDLGSKSGTFVNGQRLEAPHVLKHRDQVRVGNTVLEFHSLAEFARSAVPPQSPSVDASNGGGTREGSVSGTSALAEPRPAETPSRPAVARNWLELGTALLALALLGLSIWRTFHS